MKPNNSFEQITPAKKEDVVETPEKEALVKKGGTSPERQEGEALKKLEALFLDYQNVKGKFELEEIRSPRTDVAMEQITDTMKQLDFENMKPEEKFRLAYLIRKNRLQLEQEHQNVLIGLWASIISEGRINLTKEFFEEKNLHNSDRKSIEDIWKLHIVHKKIKAIENTLDLPLQWEKLDYEPFDPYLELRKIKFFTSDERGMLSLPERQNIQRQRLEKYKENLYGQKRGVSEMITFLDEKIHMNPDMSQRELTNFIYARAAQLKLTPHQLTLFERGIEKYVNKHNSVQFWRKEYPDDRILFQKCFGPYPIGDILVETGPMTLNFRCHDLRDYTIIYNGGHYYSEESMEIANRSGGVSISECSIHQLQGCIIAENSSLFHYSSEAEEIRTHEEQHAIKRIFSEELLRYMHISDIGEINPDDFLERQDVIDILRAEREEMESRAKDEILAYFKEGTSRFSTGVKLLEKRSKGGIYDYYQDWLDGNGYRFRNFFEQKGIKDEEMDDLFDRVFVREYKKVIERALRAVGILGGIFRNKEKEKIIYCLITEPLSGWMSLAQRFQDMENYNEKERMLRLEEYIENRKEGDWAQQEDSFRRKQAKSMRPFRKKKFSLKASAERTEKDL